MLFSHDSMLTIWFIIWYLASRLAAGPTLAYAEAKKAIQAAALPALEDVLAREQAAQSRLGQTADHKGAVAAFLSKRLPEFHGR